MILAVDTETTGTDRWHGCRPFLITACDGKSNYHFWGTVNPYNRMEVTWDEETLVEVQQLLNHCTVLVFHNAKFDLHMLESIGIDLEPLWGKIEDTLIASHCLSSGESHNLKYLAFKYMDYDDEDESELEIAVRSARNANKDYDIARKGHPSFPGAGGARTQWYKMDYWLCPEECLQYGMGDVERTWGLWQIFYEAILHHELLSQYETRKKLIRIAFDMEHVGYNIYADEIRDEIAYLEDRKDTLHKAICKESKMGLSFDPDSESSVRFFLFTVLKLEPTRYTEKTGVPSMSKQAIEELIEENNHLKSLRYFQEYRTAVTQIGYLNSYLKWVCDDNRIRQSIFLTGTRNTRQASRDPNLQNIDKRLRHVFGPEPGKVWIDFDLVSIEPRIWAYLTGNKELINLLETGRSPHLFFSELLHPEEFAASSNFKEEYEFTLYKYVKAGGLSIMYGAQGPTADQTFHKVGAYETIVERMPELPRFNAECANQVFASIEQGLGAQITCLGGYRLDVPVDDIHVAPNSRIQGTAGWIIGEAMINVKADPDYQSSGAEMINQVHDSIVIEVDEDKLTDSLIASLQKSIESAGLKYLPTCKASFHIIKSNEQ